MREVAQYIRSLDPRLKMVAALLLGPAIWLLPPFVLGIMTILLFPIVVALTASQPLGSKMLRSILSFLVFWVILKSTLDGLSGVPIDMIVVDSGILGLRLACLILLGLSLALSTSARSLGLAISWAITPFVGRERGWKVALSLALVVHFLPQCLSTMNRVQETTSRRCPDFGFFRRMTIIPQAALRGLGQKTWNQTLAIAGRRLDDAEGWQPDFVWSSRDTLCSVVLISCLISFLILTNLP